MSTKRNEQFQSLLYNIAEGTRIVDIYDLDELLTGEIVELQLLCDAELQERADHYPDTDGGIDDGTT